MQRTVERLRERPKEDRVIVAGSVAVSVVAVLFLGWGASHVFMANGAAEIASPQGATLKQNDIPKGGGTLRWERSSNTQVGVGPNVASSSPINEI